MKPPIKQVFPVPLDSYPHMMDAEALIWTEFLLLNMYPTAHAAYDVHVGTEPTLPPDTDPNMVTMANALFTKRIDVVLFHGSTTIIFEVKPNASSSAIGQAICYTLLFARDYPIYPNPFPCILTDKAHVDTAFLCKSLNILLLETNELL